MRLTKLIHACVRLEKDGSTLVIDPGVWAGPEALAGANAVLVTHEHYDHVDVDGLKAALAGDPELQVWTHAGVAGALAGEGYDDRVHAVSKGERFDAAGFDVLVQGENHALLHPEIPIVPNVGFVVDGEIFHPGDALTVPDQRVSTLLLPVNAPWLKIGEVLDYAREVAPARAFAIHDALVHDRGVAGIDNWLGLAARPLGATFTRLEPGTSVDL